MAGPEGLARVDEDRQIVWQDSMPVMRAVDEKPPGTHRRQPGQAFRHPVRLGKPREAESGRSCAGREQRILQHRALLLVGLMLQIDREAPALLIGFPIQSHARKTGLFADPLRRGPRQSFR